MNQLDSIRISIFAELFSSVATEMGNVLERASLSPNIKERKDYSCAIFNSTGDLIAQAAHIPVHLGAMESLMKLWLSDGPIIETGEQYICNDPFFAGTHLPDISLLQAVAIDSKIIGFVACRAHHADVGGNSPGSIGPEKSIFEEGVIISPSKYDSESISEFLKRARNTSERLGDLEAQSGAIRIGAKRFKELWEKLGNQAEEIIQECLIYSQVVTDKTLAKIPIGKYGAIDYLEDVPMIGENAQLKLTVTKSESEICFDFSGSEKQVEIGINATEAVTRSACYYFIRCLAPDVPTNGGCWRNVKIIAPAGSILNATFPAPVVAGNTETSQRIVDLIFQALQPGLPDLIPACSQGTMNNLAIGNDKWAYYETIGGGAGAGPNRDGLSGIQVHMTNTLNTPIEVIEREYPLRVTEYSIRRGSGGNGLHRGGDGIVREIEVLEKGLTLTLMTDRRQFGPPGANGGKAGKPGRNFLIRDGKNIELPSKTTVELLNKDRVRIETPGGGGWGTI